VSWDCADDEQTLSAKLNRGRRGHDGPVEGFAISQIFVALIRRKLGLCNPSITDADGNGTVLSALR